MTGTLPLHPSGDRRPAATWKRPARRPRVRYRWLRGGRADPRAPPVAATGCRHADVGRRVQVRVTARKPRATGPRTRVVAPDARGRPPRAAYGAPVDLPRRDPRAGSPPSLATFRRQVAADLRRPARLALRGRAVHGGWRRGGDFTRGAGRGPHVAVVLVGLQRGVELPGRALRRDQPAALEPRQPVVEPRRPSRCATYRHMVVNHETGHWLGHGHLGCAGRGRPAPVMMQQSKGLAGCRHNPWPLPSELWSR